VIADILSFEAGVRLLRGPAAETERKACIAAKWREARTRAYHGAVHKADVGLFGLEALRQARSPVFIDRELTILPDPPAAAATGEPVQERPCETAQGLTKSPA